MHLIGQAYWIAASVIATGILHMVVVKKDLFAALKRPLDGGMSLRGRRIFGDNKTCRGVVVMIAGGAILGAIQGGLFGDWAARSGVAALDYTALVPAGGSAAMVLGYAWVGALIGLGYAIGELPNSFLKRRLSIGPGDKGRGAVGAVMLVADHTDSVIGSMGLITLAFGLGWRFFLTSLVALSLIHFVIVAALYLSRVKERL